MEKLHYIQTTLRHSGYSCDQKYCLVMWYKCHYRAFRMVLREVTCNTRMVPARPRYCAQNNIKALLILSQIHRFKRNYIFKYKILKTISERCWGLCTTATLRQALRHGSVRRVQWLEMTFGISRRMKCKREHFLVLSARVFLTLKTNKISFRAPIFIILFALYSAFVATRVPALNFNAVTKLL